MAREDHVGDNGGAWNAVLKVAWKELGDKIMASPDCMKIMDRVRAIRAANGRQGGNTARKREVKVLIAVRDGLPYENAASLEIRHRTPVAYGGKDEWKNLELLT